MTAREQQRATRTDTVLCAVFALLVCSVYADPLFSGRTFGGRDLLAYNLPSEFAVHDAYSRGRWPTWNAAVSGGRPLLANPNAGALYPIRPALARAPFSMAVKIFPVLHWALAGVGMLLLSRALGISPWGAWIGAVTFTFSGVSVSEVFFPHVQPGMTLLPWVCWAFIRPSVHRGRRVALLSFLLGIDFLSGDVFTCGLAVVCLLFWVGLGTEPTMQKRALADLGAALLLAGCIAAPQILATALWIPQTNRAVLGVKLGEALLYAVSPLRLLEFVIPYPFGATWALEPDLVWRKSVFGGRPIGLFTTFYCGAFALVSLTVTRRSSEAGVRFARATLLTGLLVSVLPSLAPRGWAGWRSPVALRNPEKLVVAAVFGLAILAAFGVDWLRRQRPRRGWTLGVAVLLTLAALAASLLSASSGRFGAWVGADQGFAGVADRQLPAALAEAGLAWVLTAIAVDLLGGRRRESLLAAMILLTAVLLGADRRVARTFPENEAFPPTAFARMVARRDPAGDYRTIGESAYGGPSSLEKRYANLDFALAPERRNWAEHTQALWRRGTVFNDDFDAGDLARVAALRRLSGVTARRGNGDFFRNFSLRWGIRYRDQAALPGYRRIGGDALQDWDELDGARPDVRLLERWREEGDVRRIPAEMQTLSPGEVILETGESRSGSARPGQVGILERTPEALALDVVCPDATFLFVLRDYWEYRTILLDGHAVEAVPAQIAFSALPVPAGRHRIQWREQMPGGRLSRWGPVLFAALCGWLLIPGTRRLRPQVRA